MSKASPTRRLRQSIDEEAAFRRFVRLGREAGAQYVNDAG